MARSNHFKRVVLGLHPGTANSTVHLAADLANLLNIDLLGLLLEDTNLRRLANMPFARELRLPAGVWQAIEVEQLAHEVELASQNIRRRFARAAERLSQPHEFEVIRGTPDMIAALGRVGDIMVIGESASPADRASHQYSSLIEAAFRASSSTLFVPIHVARTSGPIVAIASGRTDPSIAAAAVVATAAKESLIILHSEKRDLDDKASIDALAAQTGLSVNHVLVGKNAISDMGLLLSAFYRFEERLIVLNRNNSTYQRVMAIAASRRSPILLVHQTEPAQIS